MRKIVPYVWAALSVARHVLLGEILEWVSYAAITYGFWLAWPPLGFIIGGVLGLNVVVGTHRKLKEKHG